jgi:hypothetical protein
MFTIWGFNVVKFKYCVTFGTENKCDYKQASDGAGLQRVLRHLRTATAPRQRSIFIIVFRDNVAIYRAWRGERGRVAMAGWGLDE